MLVLVAGSRRVLYLVATYVALLQCWTEGSARRFPLPVDGCEAGLPAVAGSPASPKRESAYLFWILKKFELTGCDVRALGPESKVPVATSI